MSKVNKNKNLQDILKSIDTKEMMNLGLHLGHKTSKRHPKMIPFILGIRNNISIIDLEKTKDKLKEALIFLDREISNGKNILFVGTPIQLKDLVKNIAKKSDMPYVVERWIGGTFTNFEQIKKRIDYYKDLEEKFAKGAFSKYTKKEKQKIEKELENLRKKFEGLKKVEKLPDIVFICDLVKNELAAKEAKKVGIKVIAICDTNSNPDLADFPIPASDDGRSAVEYILDKILKVINLAKEKYEISSRNKKT